jgi:hypothetical protein
MKQPSNNNQNAIMIVGILLGVGIVVLAALVAFLFRGNLFPLATPATETPLIPTMFVPTPDCGPPTLVLGATTLQIQTINPVADGPLSVPPDTSDIAYWVEGTDTNYVFVLSPTPNNLGLQTVLKIGDLVTIYLANCNVISFAVSAIEPKQLSDPTLLDQSISGMSLFVQTDSSGAGFVVKGEIPEETISVLDTPRPDESGILAEVSLLETSTSPDGTTIKLGVSILNYGQTTFTVSSSNVSLTPQDAAPLILASSEPSLPKEINPGSIETFIFTFPRPSTQIATLKIFTVEYDIKGY